MLNFIYYPVSFILWCWHTVFGFVLGDASAVGWALSIVFLVFTLRALLLKPAIKQIRSMRKMQKFAPQMKAIKKQYPDDRQRQTVEMQRLQREHGVSPLGGCLPMISQIPVFIGLNHVLRTFTQHPNHPNYFFPLADVHSYLDAKLFDAHLGDAIFNTGLIGGSAAGHATWAWGVAPVAIPLMIIAAIATHFTARSSAKRAVQAGASGAPQSQLMNKLAMWVFPLGVLVFGAALPVGLLIYWVSNNIWTFGQQHFVFKRIAEEDKKEALQTKEAQRSRAPRPGQRPSRHDKSGHHPEPPRQKPRTNGHDLGSSATGKQAQDAKRAGPNGAGRVPPNAVPTKTRRKRPRR